MAPERPARRLPDGSSRLRDDGSSEVARDDEELSRLIAQHTNDLITLYDADGRRVYTSPSVTRALGPLGNTFAGIHPDDQEAARLSWTRTLAGETSEITFRHAHPDGSWRWLEGRGSLVHYRGKPHVLAVSRDVTERERGEEERRAHLTFLESMDRVNRAIQGTTDLERMMSAVLDATLDIFDCDRAWLVYPCDPAAAAFHVPMERTRPQFPGAFVIGAPIPITPDVAGLIDAVRSADGPVTMGADSAIPIPAALVAAFGIQSQIAMAVYPRVDRPYVFGLHQCSYCRIWSQQERRLFQEIGRRLGDALTTLLAYRNLRDSELRLEDSQRIAHVGYWDRDLERGRITLSAEARRIFGLTAGEEVFDLAAWHQRWLTLVHPDDRERVTNVVAATMRGGARYKLEYRIIRPNGETRAIRSEGETTTDPEGQPRRIFGVMQDVTELRQAEAALVESHGLLKAILNGIPEAVYLKDREGRYVVINSAGARCFGRSPDEVIGRTDFDLLDAATARRIRECEQKAGASGGSYTAEEAFGTGRGRQIFLATRTVHRDAHGEVVGVIGVSSDITELKQLEEQLRHAQKMEAVGRLAGGVAHDFNNLLTVINSYSEMVLNTLAVDDPNRQRLAEVVRAGERATRLVAQLLAFGRKQMLQPEVVSLNDILRELLKLLRPLIGEDIDLDFVPDADLGPAKVDPGQFEQAIINLAVNARDAMPHGGRLRIVTRNAELGKDQVKRRSDARAGGYVLVTVSDTGEGMDAATQAQVFEPFFTTKEPGKGSGLGLAMVYGFVTQSGGFIEVDSEPGRGTTFKVYLPRTGEAVASAAAAAEPTKAPTGGETVLLVEDEDAVRTLARIVLQTTGYTVLEARSGSEAVRIAASHDGPIHLLVSDLVMPQMGGRQLGRLLRETRPSLRVLFMSGYPDDQAPEGTRDGPSGFLQKPFTPTVLARKVREVLDAHP